MRFVRTNSLTEAQKKELLILWNSEYPQNLNYENLQGLEDYLAQLEDQNHLLLLDERDHIQGWYFDFIRDGVRWFIIILDAQAQSKKLGSRMIELAKQQHSELNGWIANSNNYQKANGQPYYSPINFYRKHGFHILPNVKLETNKISVIKIKWSKPAHR
jgi:GNAT superfamily N-acetyltransferase